MTTVLVLVILGLIWAAVLLPPYLQNRREHRPGDSIASFRHQLAVIERTTPDGRARPASRFDDGWDPRAVAQVPAYRPVGQGRPAGRPAPRIDPGKQRRKEILVGLLAACGITLLAALLVQGPMLLLHLALDVALGAYVVMLVNRQKLNAERDLKVRFLQPAGQPMGQPGSHLRSIPGVERPGGSYEQSLLRRVGS